MTTSKRILISSGETSGDFYAASLIDSLLEYPELEIHAIGGIETKKRKVNMIADSTDWGAIGLMESIKQLPIIMNLWKIKRLLSKSRFDLFIAVDYPGFNMAIVRMAKKMGIPTLFYFPPSKFAESPEEVKEAAEKITKVAATFSTTYKIYKEAKADVEFVGHPMVDLAKPSMTKEETIKFYNMVPDKPVVALCPGSRRSELFQMLPTMLEAAKEIHKKFPDYQFAVPVIKTDTDEVFNFSKKKLKTMLEKSKLPITLAEGNIYNVMNLSDLVIISSGTATLEAAVVGVPMIVCYKVGFLTEIQANLFYKLPNYIALPNLILGELAVPELIQDDFTVKKLSETAIDLIANKESRNKQFEAFERIRKRLGPDGANASVVRMVLSLLNL